MADEILQISDFESGVVAGVRDCAGAVKQCAVNAVANLRQALQLVDVDREMAVFRSIIAEEEAATSLLLSVKNHGYPNATKLSFKQHPAKLGVYPFIQAIGAHLFPMLKDQSPFGNYQLFLTKCNDRGAVGLRLLTHSGDAYEIKPPLNFQVSKVGEGPFLFHEIFKTIAQRDGFNTGLKRLQAIAQLRNDLIYADAQGAPRVAGDIEAVLAGQQKKVFTILTLLLMFDPWERGGESSLFMKQAVESYLHLLERIHPISEP